jgi:hypothetical protein
MKFWKRLRWLATGVFLALVLVAWWSADPGTASGRLTDPSTRPPPAF